MSDHVWIDVEDRTDATKWHTVDKFQEYEIKQNLFNEVGTFSLVPTPTSDCKGIFWSGEQRIRIMCNDALQFTGVTDDCESGAATGEGSYMNLTGRDMGRWLQDVAFLEGKSFAGWTLQRFVEYATAPWEPTYIRSVVVDDAPAHYVMSAKQRSRWRTIRKDGKLQRVKVTGSRQRAGKASPYYRGIDLDKLRQKRVSPGASRIGHIRQFAAQVACFVYMTAQAQMFVGRPSYDRVEYDDLVFTSRGSNVLAATWQPSTSKRYATYTIIAQGRSARTKKGRDNNRKIDVVDPSPAFWQLKTDGTLQQRLYKPQVLTVPNGCQNKKLLRRLARTTVEEAAVKSYNYEVELMGHSRDGVLWAPNACVNVRDDYNGVYGQHMIVGRRFRKSIDEGTTTVLTLIPSEVWLYLDHDDINDNDWQDWIRTRVTW
jgi:prophage tail gpP-like protein